MEFYMSHKVLLVEDHGDVRALFRVGLEHEGFQVIEAADGLEMLSILQLQDVSAVVVDLAMPRIDGISAIRTVKTMPRRQDSIIIVVTALADADLRLRAHEAGATEFLTKPILPQQLAQALHRHLSPELRAE
jgi:two-component system chemotaxis response regulator CheY